MHTSVTFQGLERHLFPHEHDAGVLRWEHHTVTTGSVFYHYHPQYELNLVEAGSVRRIVGDDESTVAGRELVLIGPNMPHRWEPSRPGFSSDATNRDGRLAEFWVAAFSRESIGLELLGRPEMRAARGLLERSSRGLRFSTATTEVAGPRLQALGDSDGIRRVAHFLELLHTLADDSEAEPIVSEAYESSDVEADYRLVAELVERVTGEEARANRRRPSLTDAAAFARMSVPTFTRFFRRMTGRSFISYINSLRVARACTLLKETALAIVDVCEESGFDNLSHFNRQFLKQVGVQPRVYRVRARG
jgi:AraC-like DNA-binding protein